MKKMNITKITLYKMLFKQVLIYKSETLVLTQCIINNFLSSEDKTIKNMLKRRRESDNYLAIDSRLIGVALFPSF